MPKLKVFCTTSGFYDHLVAAPSRPAALKAWGAKTDLFAMGVARLVSDPKLEKRALERPGEVIRLTRSSGDGEVASHVRTKKKTKRPSRAKLDAAEKRLAEISTTQAREADDINRQLKDLQRKRDQLEESHGKTRRAAEKKVEEARDAYEVALADWSPI